MATTSLVRSPVVQRHPVKESNLPNAGRPHANVAATESHPDGTTNTNYSSRVSRQTVLQQHVNFWDRDNDGIIWPLDTFKGFYELGYGVILSWIALLVIHSNFSYPTVHGLLPDPFFRIWVDRIHRDKHGSDSGTYDNEGRFIPDKFENFFEKYSSQPRKDGLTAMDTVHGIYGQRCIMDPVGWGAAIFEWLATWILLWPRDGVIRKDDVRAIYDGSIFWRIAKQRGVQLHGSDPANAGGL